LRSRDVVHAPPASNAFRDHGRRAKTIGSHNGWVMTNA
jgi:hypothetical protein